MDPDVASLAQYEDFVRLHERLSARPRAHARRLWLCGLGTSLIVAALMLGGVGLVRALFGSHVPVPVGGGLGTEAVAFAYAATAMIATLQATALLHVLITVVERPVRAFVGIGAMAVTLMTILPLTLRVPAAAAWATSGLNLAGGTALVGLLAAVADACVRWPQPPSERRHR